MAPSDEISNFAKTDVEHNEYYEEKEARNGINRIDAVVTAPETTLESFADLDEKKILRKVEALLRVSRKP